MRLDLLAEQIGAEAITPTPSVEIDRVVAGGSISDLLAQATPAVVLVTTLSSAALPRVARLMDAPALCLVRGAAASPELVQAAREHGTALLVSPFGMAETCSRLSECLKRVAP